MLAEVITLIITEHTDAKEVFPPCSLQLFDVLIVSDSTIVTAESDRRMKVAEYR